MELPKIAEIGVLYGKNYTKCQFMDHESLGPSTFDSSESFVLVSPQFGQIRGRGKLTLSAPELNPTFISVCSKGINSPSYITWSEF